MKEDRKRVAHVECFTHSLTLSFSPGWADFSLPLVFFSFVVGNAVEKSVVMHKVYELARGVT